MYECIRVDESTAGFTVRAPIAAHIHDPHLICDHFWFTACDTALTLSKMRSLSASHSLGPYLCWNLSGCHLITYFLSAFLDPEGSMSAAADVPVGVLPGGQGTSSYRTTPLLASKAAHALSCCAEACAAAAAEPPPN